MTSMDKQHDHSRSDENLDRLLELGEPAPRMPENLKTRIRSRLAEVGQESGKKKIRPGHWTVWPLAATAALVFLLIVFWNDNSPSTIAWADVQEQLNQVHTMTFKAYTRISETTGMRITEINKVYHKDPGLTRTEEYAPDAGPGSVKEESKQIIITRRQPGNSEVMRLYPGSSRAERYTKIFLASGPEPPSQPSMDLASVNWKMMKEITENKTRRIGNRVINDIPAAGFEFEIPDWAYVNPGTQVRAQLWAGGDNRVPLLIEVEYQTPEGQNVYTEISDIQWNVPLDKSLFDLAVPEGWSLSRTHIESAEYTDAGLAPGIILQIGPDGQEPLAATGDVAGVVRGEQITHPRKGISREIHITIELKPEAMQRLRDYIDAYPEELIVVDFNGQIKVAANLYWASLSQLSFNLSLLNLSLAELEAGYFTTSIEREEPLTADFSSAGLSGDEAQTFEFELRLASMEEVEGWESVPGPAPMKPTIWISPQAILTNADVAQASPQLTGEGFNVGILLTEEGALKLARLTKSQIGEFVAIMLDGRVTAVPKIMAEITGGRALVHGNFTEDEARLIAQGITAR